jgi:hypothetical protein
VKYLMNEDVRLERTHEEKGRGARIAHAQHACRLGALEVLRHDLQPAPRRRIRVARVERQNDRCLGAREHVDGKVLGERPLHERHELLGQPAKNDARIGRRIRGGQLEDELRDFDTPRLHGRGEERLLAGVMTEDGCGRYLHLPGDVGERRGLEALVGEYPPRGLEKAITLNDCRPAHL